MSEEIHKYVRLTKVWDSFKEKGIRIAGDTKPLIIDLLNKYIFEKIGEISDTLPKISKGPNKGNMKRKTIKPEDLEGL